METDWIPLLNQKPFPLAKLLMEARCNLKYLDEATFIIA